MNVANADACPGHRRCYALGGTKLCRVHGCRVCGAAILADTEEWPAPLCIVHAPEPLIDYVLQARRALLGLCEFFDGVHSATCALWQEAGDGRMVSDATLAEGLGSVRCTCAAYAVRQGARVHFNLKGERTWFAPARDTERPPAPPSERPEVVSLGRLLLPHGSRGRLLS